MVDTLIDDIDALLTLEKGDGKVLEQIKRAAINNEVISNYERGYVRGLAEKYLGRKIITEQKTEENSKVILTEQKLYKPQPETKINSSPTNSKTKIYVGIGVSIFVVIIAIGIGMSNISFDSVTDSLISSNNQINSNLKTDLSSYNNGDIISISGNTDKSLGDKISLSIKNPEGILVWSETVSVKSSGKFSTLAIAGGPNWDSGKYILESIHGNKKTSITFTFNA